MVPLKRLALAGALLTILGCDQPAAGPTERGKVLFRRGEWNEAIKACNEAIEIGPDAEAYICRGRSFQCLGDMERAIYDFSYAIRFDPKNPEGYYQRALAYESQGDTKRAADDRETAHQFDPAFAEAQLQRPEMTRPHFTNTEESSRQQQRHDDLSVPGSPYLEMPAVVPGRLSEDTFGGESGGPSPRPVVKDVYGLPIGAGTAQPSERLFGRQTDQKDAPPRDAFGLRPQPLSEPEGGLVREPDSSGEKRPTTLSRRAPGAAAGVTSPSRSQFSPGDHRSSGGQFSRGGASGSLTGGQPGPNGGTTQSAPRPYGVSSMRSTGLKSQPEQAPLARPPVSSHFPPSTGGSSPSGDRPDLRPSP